MNLFTFKARINFKYAKTLRILNLLLSFINQTLKNG